jgi:hypothetical protein
VNACRSGRRRGTRRRFASRFVINEKKKKHLHSNRQTTGRRVALCGIGSDFRKSWGV